MKRAIKFFLILLAGILVITAAGFTLYLYQHYPRKAESFEIANPNPSKKILIATQSSEFKDILVQNLCDSLISSPVYIKGIDLDMLPQIHEEEWDKIFLINTYMISLNSSVKNYLENCSNPENNLMLVTSGGDDWKPESGLKIDALTSASKKENISELVKLMNDWVKCDNSSGWIPHNYITALKYFAGINVERACKSIESSADHYRKIYPDIHRELNRIGYHYLRIEDIKSAVKIFSLNVKLFPDKWNGYDSLGEALLHKGDLEGAISNYEKALALNPESEYSRNALESLSN